MWSCREPEETRSVPITSQYSLETSVAEACRALRARQGSTAVGVYGHDSATRTVRAVIDHNSDFAVVVVPEPGTLALAGLGLAAATALLRRHRAAWGRSNADHRTLPARHS